MLAARSSKRSPSRTAQELQSTVRRELVDRNKELDIQASRSAVGLRLLASCHILQI